MSDNAKTRREREEALLQSINDHARIRPFSREESLGAISELMGCLKSAHRREDAIRALFDDYKESGESAFEEGVDCGFFRAASSVRSILNGDA